MKGYENLQKKVCIFYIETVNDCFRKKMCSRYFLCWRPKKIPNWICHNNAWRTHMGALWTIFNMFFIVVLIPGTQRITLLLNHQRCFSYSLKKVTKNLQYILCRNREDLCSYFCIYFVQKPWKKMCSWYFFILKIVWLLPETFQYFLKNVRPLVKKY